jgi:demethylmenaquinone methyltransferase/2-methoxy-6-polyprenyl-1,4-benzoquinol methylase
MKGEIHYCPVSLPGSAYNTNMSDEIDHFANRVTRTYNALSGTYDMLSGKAEQRLTQEALVLFDLKPEFRILDIGFGTGNALAALCERLPDPGHVFGLDISLGMCRAAQGKLLRKMVIGNTALCCANALQAPYLDSQFDGILLTFTFELFPEDLFIPLLKECRRLLKPRGKLVLVSMAPADRAGLVYRLYLWAHRKYPQWIDCRPVDAARILQDNGFQVLWKSTKNLFGLPVDSILAQ